jgi:hypothetical protein
MTTPQAPGAQDDAPLGRAQAESNRTAGPAPRAGEDFPPVSALPVAPSHRRLPPARDPHSPPRTRPDPPDAPDTAPTEKPALLSQRTALILFMALCAGIGIGVLTFLAKKSYPEAVIAGVLTTGACAVGLHNVVG